MPAFPGLIEWSPVFNVGVPSIDSQHQLLVSLIKKLQQAMLEGRTKEVVVPLFRALNQYTQLHFAHEEELLREYGYPEVAAHHAQHANLITKLQDLEDQFAAGRLTAGAPIMQFLRNWLTDHICDHDKKFASLLKQKGVS